MIFDVPAILSCWHMLTKPSVRVIWYRVNERVIESAVCAVNPLPNRDAF